ncbi:LemA family protein [Parashewanella spongiae]|uniref:LemA family protein n=1 Tax=Parashewanella spongiae TaxID=342950 RepID=A0A3A6TXQ4_9GAMM|nr:LemA family protein [Parashewanella spongiae]MCL1077089.1 LemA family protein [Parashewanella spongiae]RJY17675.1 LemA family protein [Parashewanella spongiae]
MDFIVLLFIIAIGFAFWGITTYNKLQAQKQEIIEQSSNIQVSQKKRTDLASRIIDIAKGVGDHEKLTHLQVSSAQTASIENLSALSQSFPELKANETYLKLMDQLHDLENSISERRESYNKSVKNYNSFRSSFPTMLVANKLSFEAASYYDSNDEESLNNIATFSRDDSEAVRAIIESSTNSIKRSTQKIADSASSQIKELKENLEKKSPEEPKAEESDAIQK